MLASLVGTDWVWVALVVVVLFGGSQLPKLARNAGDAMKEFRKAHNEVSEPEAPAPQVLPAAASVAPLAAPAPAAPLASAPAAGTAGSDERLSLTRSELDALLADREARARSAQSGKTEG